MLDDRMLELLNAEIDDALSAADRAELSRRLLNEPEARAAREALRRTCAGLDALPLAEPPAELRERILAALPQGTQATSRGGQFSRRFLSSASTLRYAAAIVGAVLVGTIAFEANRNANGVDTDQAVGTMASPPVAAQAGPGVLRVDSSHVRGMVTLAPTAQQLGVRFDFDAAQPSGAAAPEAIDVVVTRGDRVAHLRGFAAAQQASGTALAAEMPGAVAAGETVEVRVIASGVPVFEARWRAPAIR
jgi:hypothetical protein